MSSGKRIDTGPQTQELETSTNKIVSEIQRQKTEQGKLLGTLLENQQSRTAATKESLQQQSAVLGTALSEILSAFSGFSEEAESAASGANAAAERAAASRQESYRNPRTLGSAALLQRRGSSVDQASGVGSSRRETNIFGRIQSGSYRTAVKRSPAPRVFGPVPITPGSPAPRRSGARLLGVLD